MSGKARHKCGCRTLNVYKITPEHRDDRVKHTRLVNNSLSHTYAASAPPWHQIEEKHTVIGEFS